MNEGRFIGLNDLTDEKGEGAVEQPTIKQPLLYPCLAQEEVERLAKSGV